MAIRVKNIILASLNCALGVALGLGLLETTLRANPSLLLHGMALLVPIDPPITTQSYEIHYSDADLFFWHPDLIRPIPAVENKIEAQVQFVTDEFGFPNPAPLPATVDVVVLGRSYSLGAQTAMPWPRRLAEQTGWTVQNLSQAGSGLLTKNFYLQKFGLPHRPKWVVIDVLTSMDVIGYTGEDAPLLIERLPVPLIQFYGRQFIAAQDRTPDMPIYPLKIDLPTRSVSLTFFSYYLSALSVDNDTLTASTQWAAFRQTLLSMVAEARAEGACVALLYVPTKPNVYLPLAIRPEQLTPVLPHIKPWRLNDSNDLVEDDTMAITINQLVANAQVARDLVASFAREQMLVFIDPSEAMTEQALAGESPFMTYDTHWSAVGHKIVADLVAQTLQHSACP